MQEPPLACDGCVSGDDQGQVLLLEDVFQLIRQNVSISTDDCVDLSGGFVFESNGDERVEDAGFDSSHVSASQGE